MHYKLFADKTRYLKESAKGVSEMCKMMEELREESLAEGIEIGIEKGSINTMRELVQVLKTQGKSIHEIEQTAAMMGYSPKDVAEWLTPAITV